MTVYLLRHGIAEDNSASGRDSDRELTTEGKARLKDVLKRARKGGVEPSVILTSPFRRALQTANLAAKEFEAPEPQRCEALVPSSHPQSVWKEVGIHEQGSEMLLVGHEPLFSQTVSYLLNAPSLNVDIKTGAMVAIEFATLRGEPRGTLRWMLTPRICG